MCAKVTPKVPPKEGESEDDKELQEELKVLVDKITGKDRNLVAPALEMLKFLIRTSTTSMTSVPKPLKYLAPYYEAIKDAYNRMDDTANKKKCADIISVLAMGPVGGDAARTEKDCLRYCLLGTMSQIGDWGHEYIRQLESEIISQWAVCPNSTEQLLPLVKDIVKFDCMFHAEIQACDLLMEIDQLDLLPKIIDKTIYQRMCLYLFSCTKYVDESEAMKLLNLVTGQYLRFDEYPRALLLAMHNRRADIVQKIFTMCKDLAVLRQLAFMVARQLFVFEMGPQVEIKDDLLDIMSNSHLSSYFLTLTRELDIMEPKSPEDVYKSWLEPTPLRHSVLGEVVDSARQNLASSFVNGFVNAGFGSDKILTTDGGNKWIFRNKDHGMVSATAALGLIYLWDVDGGLTPIDKYLYTQDEHVKVSLTVDTLDD